MVVCQENALICDRLLATAWKIKRTACIMEVVVQSHKKREKIQRESVLIPSDWVVKVAVFFSHRKGGHLHNHDIQSLIFLSKSRKYVM